MRGHCYAVASGKGGVGKTTTVVNTACELVKRGLEVVVVDADLAMSNLGRMVGVDHEPTLHEVLAGEASLSAAINTDGEVAVVPGSDAIDGFRDADPAELSKVAKRLQTAFDVILVDTGAGVDHETMVACGVADDSILVTTANETAVTDTKKSQSLVESVDGTTLGVIVTRSDETDASRVAETLGTELLGVVPDAADIVGDEPVVTNAPESKVATAYSEIAWTLAVTAEATSASTSDEQAIHTDD